MSPRSMTGFGSGRGGDGIYALTAEVRSVNGRQREVRVRLPAELAALESELREKVQARVARGRVEVAVAWDRGRAPDAGWRLDTETARVALEAWQELEQTFGLDDPPTAAALLRLPGVWAPAPPDPVDLDHVRGLIETALADALDAFDAARAREGERLVADLRRRRDLLVAAVERIRERAARFPERAAQRLREQVAALLEEVPLDEQRLAQEIAIGASRADVSEELVRLDAHLARLSAAVDADGGEVGRTLDFLVQEIRREVNTIGAKMSDPAVDSDVLAIKGELEKIREQAANLE